MSFSSDATPRSRSAARVLPAIIAVALIAGLSLAPERAPAAGVETVGPWPSPAAGADVLERNVRIESASPFTPDDIGDAPAEWAVGRYVRPADPPAARKLPAVVLLHGAGGVIAAREIAYARQFARQGVAALVIDAFAARRHLATSFTERLIRITETMVLADAFAGLRWLADRPEIDGERIALIGFSYGGMASVFAAYEQVATRLAGDGPRFAAHVAFYAPCVARFKVPTTTGAPVLMLWGGRDEIIDPEACRAIAGDLRRGGSRVQIEVFPEGLHQWDGASARPWRASRGLADCAFSVDEDGAVRDVLTFLPMAGPRTRTVILAACVDSDGYLIGRDDAIRARSNRVLGRFLKPVLQPVPRSRAGELATP